MEELPEISFGGVKLETPKTKQKRISALLWGPAGQGKTTLAGTAPGRKLWINFDVDGTNAVSYRDDVAVFDLAPSPNNIVMKFRKGIPAEVSEAIEQYDPDTIVIDSLTNFGEKALAHGIIEAQGTSKGRKATIEDPGYAGYGNKNVWTRLIVKNFLEETAKLNKHVIFIAHEDKPLMDDQGIVLYISIMLGSSLNAQVPIDFSEVWHVSDTGKERRIAIRQSRSRRPMKSRMFISSGDPEFVWNYDADTDEGSGISDWYDQWSSNDGKKIELPTK